MKKLAIIVLSVIAITTYAQKETKNKTKSLEHSIGIGAGFTTGFGLSYRYMPKKYGVQINLAPFYTDYMKNSTVSIGVTLLDKIVEGSSCNLYTYFANHYLIRRGTGNDNIITNEYGAFNNSTNSVSNNNDKWNTGLGLGFEFNTNKRVVLNIMGGIAQYNTFESLLPTVETALYYRF